MPYKKKLTTYIYTFLLSFLFVPLCATQRERVDCSVAPNQKDNSERLERSRALVELIFNHSRSTNFIRDAQELINKTIALEARIDCIFYNAKALDEISFFGHAQPTLKKTMTPLRAAFEKQQFTVANILVQNGANTDTIPQGFLDELPDQEPDSKAHTISDNDSDGNNADESKES